MNRGLITHLCIHLNTPGTLPAERVDHINIMRLVASLHLALASVAGLWWSVDAFQQRSIASQLTHWLNNEKRRTRLFYEDGAANNFKKDGKKRFSEPLINGSSQKKASFDAKRKEDEDDTPRRRFAVSTYELEKDLFTEERTTVRVVRQAGPSVAFVTSVWPITADDSSNDKSPQQSSTDVTQKNIPRGVALGSGVGDATKLDG